MRCLVTGCAGFIGSTLTDRLLSSGHQVVGFDNLSTGHLAFLRNAQSNPNFSLFEGDLLDRDKVRRAAAGIDFVFHLAANADVRFGTEHPTKDLQQNTIATVNVLEAMRATAVKRIAFSSTGSVYGEAKQVPTPEHAAFPIQTSLYGASKVAAESFIQAYSEGFDIQAFIFRFVSILGERYTHGHVVDFYKQLKSNPTKLYVLGNGHQRKSYLYVQDCVDAILTAVEKSTAKVSVWNLGTDEYCEVNDSIGWICEELGVQPELSYAGGQRGWIGDNPFIFLDCSAIRALGWQPRLSIREGVVRTVRFLRDNPEF
ncbi:MAG TPA: NAD-dependent epimerase/dehydratase family protein [Bryobacteraceae bacterium]